MYVPDYLVYRKVDEFAELYISVKAKYAAGERGGMLPYRLENLLELDLKIDPTGPFQKELGLLLGACSDEKAWQKLYFAEKHHGPYSQYQEAYTLAKNALLSGATTKYASDVVLSIEEMATKRRTLAEKLENKGKPKEALGHYEAILQIMPSDTPEYSSAKKERDRLKKALLP